MFPVDIVKLFKNSFLIQYLQELLLTVLSWYSKVNWGACSLISHTSTCFWFWSKNFTKRTNVSLLSREKTISCLLELIGHVHLISEYVLENINCFRFWWNTYTKRCASNCNITCQNTFFPCTLRLVRCFQFQGMILKTEECRVSKNIALKTWRWKSRFWFCSAYGYFVDLKTIYFASCLCCSSKLF